MKNTNTIRPIMSCFVGAIVMCGVVLSQCLNAATLNVEFDVRTSAVENDPAHQRKNVAIFVLDRSWSMTKRPEKEEKLANGEKAKSRNQLLVDSFQERIRTISANAPETYVYLVPFAAGKGEISKRYSLATKRDVDELLKGEGLKECQKGGTYLYDTLEHVLKYVDSLSEQDPSCRFSLYIYTDGENETYKKYAKSNYPSEPKTDWHGNIINQKEYEEQKKEAKARFYKEYGRAIGAYASAGKMETYWRWLGKGEPPGDSLMKTKDEYKIALVAETSLLKNPVAASEQKLSVSAGVPLPEKYIKDLDHYHPIGRRG